MVLLFFLKISRVKKWMYLIVRFELLIFVFNKSGFKPCNEPLWLYGEKHLAIDIKSYRRKKANFKKKLLLLVGTFYKFSDSLSCFSFLTWDCVFTFKRNVFLRRILSLQTWKIYIYLDRLNSLSTQSFIFNLSA